MQIAVLTCSTINRKWLYTITNKSKEKYCSQHNYDYIFSDTFYPDPNRHPYWNKIKYIYDNLPKYDWVLWMDDDAGFISSNSIDPIFNNSYPFTYAIDFNGFNAGVMGFRNVKPVVMALEFVWYKMYPVYKTHQFPEQDALKKLFIDDLRIGLQVDGTLYNAYSKELTVSPYNQANENTVILHIAGGSQFKDQHKEDIRLLYDSYNQ